MLPRPARESALRARELWREGRLAFTVVGHGTDARGAARRARFWNTRVPRDACPLAVALLASINLRPGNFAALQRDVYVRVTSPEGDVTWLRDEQNALAIAHITCEQRDGAVAIAIDISAAEHALMYSACPRAVADVSGVYPEADSDDKDDFVMIPSCPELS